jgi:glycosyltransferase involved in cell wall biosynthesis
MNLSVCIATYNGEKFIDLQLQSIIKQLDDDDEIIIVDDCSTDNTLKVIKSISDFRIKIFLNELNRGHVYSFGRALGLASKDVIFMSDQDDIWLDDRITLMKNKLLNANVMLLSSNTNFIDSKGNKIDYSLNHLSSKTSNNYISNIKDIFLGKGYYYGCAMALKKELNNIILPIPNYVESHDLWIALAANINKSNIHCNESTLNRRIHGGNASIVSRKLLNKLWSRIIFIISIVHLFIRTKTR